MADLDRDSQNKVVLMDPLISPFLLNRKLSYVSLVQEHAGLLRRLDDESRLVILPYHEE